MYGLLFLPQVTPLIKYCNTTVKLSMVQTERSSISVHALPLSCSIWQTTRVHLNPDPERLGSWSTWAMYWFLRVQVHITCPPPTIPIDCWLSTYMLYKPFLPSPWDITTPPLSQECWADKNQLVHAMHNPWQLLTTATTWAQLDMSFVHDLVYVGTSMPLASSLTTDFPVFL